MSEQASRLLKLNPDVIEQLKQQNDEGIKLNCLNSIDMELSDLDFDAYSCYTIKMVHLNLGNV